MKNIGTIAGFCEALKNSNSTIVCYGSSSNGLFTLDLLTRYGVTVDFFADTYSHGGEFHGHKVLSPNELAELDNRESVTILVASIWVREIYQKLRDLSIRGRILVLPFCLFNYTTDALPLQTMEDIEQFRTDAALVRKNLADDTSRRILDGLVDARLTYTPEGYIRAFEETIASSGGNQYLPKELAALCTSSQLSVVDCGAYTGDTIKKMADFGIRFAKSWSFEPDPVNYSGLMKQIELLGLESQIIAVNSGVYGETGILRFNSNGLPTSHIVDGEKGESIKVVSLDEYLAGKHVDFIKMDIEGSEMGALVGATETIKRCRPLLAICVYHFFHDIVRLPLYLMEKLGGYGFMLRHYTSWGPETVLYCIPGERRYDC